MQTPRRSVTRFLLLVALLLVSPCTASAQESSRSTDVRAAVAPSACQSDGGPEPLGTHIPVEVLDHLEGIASSPFVHAFLINQLVEYGNPRHWLVKCAVTFRNTPPEQLQELAARQVEAGTIIRELRVAALASAEERRVRTIARMTLDTVVQALRYETTTPRVQALGPILHRAYGTHCGAGVGGVCGALALTLEGVDTLLMVRDRLSTATATVAAAERELVRVTQELAALAKAQVSDSATLLERAPAAQAPSTADPLALANIVSQRTAARDSLTKVRDSLQVERDSAGKREQDATADAARAERDLQNRLATLRQAMRDAPSRIGTALAVLPEGQPVRVAVTAPEVVQPAAGVTAVAPASPNVALALTDFVIDRAKQELVLAYLQRAYATMRRDSLVQAAFPETFGLMRSLATTDGESEISLAIAGRVPLSVWRTTIATDFMRLPLQLLRADPASVCGHQQDCMRHVRRLQPLAVSAQRLVAGDAVFDVMRELPVVAGAAWVDATPDLRRIVQGLALVSGVAESYQVQGIVPGADPARHPYILSARALAQVPTGQREIFVRLLLARAAPFGTELSKKVTVAALLDIVGQLARTADQVAVDLPVAAEGSARATKLVRQALATTITGTDLAYLMSDTVAAKVDTIRQAWKTFADIIDPLVARNYGLALSRSTLLLQGVTGRRPNRMLLTLTTLGAGLAEAQDGGDVRSAFEAAASPVGGWQAKRLRESNRLSITAFPGIAGGAEWLLEGDRKGEGAASIGASLPVGVDIQLLERRGEDARQPECRLFVCSVGVYMPVIDLGALMSYRLDDDPTVASEPNTTLRQVFAPGAYLSLGLGRSPFALLVGGQFMPSLRAVTGPSPAISGHAARFGVALGVDVVLLTH